MTHAETIRRDTEDARRFRWAVAKGYLTYLEALEAWNKVPRFRMDYRDM